MPLSLDDRRLLPPGLHDATLQEVQEWFGNFQCSDRRMILFEKLKRFLAELRRTGWDCTVLLDGSFVMPPVDEPNDIDVILVMPKDWDMTADLRPFEYNVVSKKYTKAEYQIEVYAVLPESDAETRMRALFEQIRIEWCRQFSWPVDSRKARTMITNDAELEVVRRQLEHAEAALESLRRDVKPKNEKTYEVMAVSYLDLVQSFRAEIDAYLGVATSPDKGLSSSPPKPHEGLPTPENLPKTS
jgi:hypothetical protein